MAGIAHPRPAISASPIALCATKSNPLASIRQSNPPKEPPECVRLAELRQAVGPYEWRTKWIAERISEGMSEETASLLALVVFEAYEF